MYLQIIDQFDRMHIVKKDNWKDLYNPNVCIVLGEVVSAVEDVRLLNSNGVPGVMEMEEIYEEGLDEELEKLLA